MTVTTKRYLIIAAIVCFVIILAVFPLETTVVPKWRLQVVDVSGTPCANMRVTESWGHYSLYIGGNDQTDDRITDSNGTVEFAKRTVRAGLARRLVVPVFAHVLVIAHGSVGPSGAVWASGIKDVAWLSYASGKPLPDKMRVEKCIAPAPNKSLDASGRSVFRNLIRRAMLE
jgi:hypothetical protein